MFFVVVFETHVYLVKKFFFFFVHLCVALSNRRDKNRTLTKKKHAHIYLWYLMLRGCFCCCFFFIVGGVIMCIDLRSLISVFLIANMTFLFVCFVGFCLKFYYTFPSSSLGEHDECFRNGAAAWFRQEKKTIFFCLFGSIFPLPLIVPHLVLSLSLVFFCCWRQLWAAYTNFSVSIGFV